MLDGTTATPAVDAARARVDAVCDGDKRRGVVWWAARSRRTRSFNAQGV
jgi:hypothetical protein